MEFMYIPDLYSQLGVFVGETSVPESGNNRLKWFTFQVTNLVPGTIVETYQNNPLKEQNKNKMVYSFHNVILNALGNARDHQALTFLYQ